MKTKIIIITNIINYFVYFIAETETELSRNKVRKRLT